MAFSLFDGRATWDTTGVTPTSTLPKLAFSEATYSTGEADGTVTITVSRSDSTSGGAIVEYATTDLGAAAGIDYSVTNG